MKIKNSVVAMAVMAIAATGCAGSSEHGHEHAHGHEVEGHAHSEHEHEHADEHYVVAAYSQNMEFYAEVSPLLVGEESELLCHFTSLDNFKPVPNGKVAATLEVNGKKTDAEEVELVKAGIFHVHIKPTLAGVAKLKVSIESPVGNSQFTIDSLLIGTDHEAVHEDMEAREVKSANGVVFTKEMSWGVDFSTVAVDVKPMGPVINTVAQILPSQGDELTVVAKTDGIVQFGNNKLVEGKAVAAGQQLCTIDASATVNNNLATQQQQAQTELQRAKTEYERLASLRQDKLALESEVQAAKAAYEQAQHNYNALHKNGGGGVQSVSAGRGGFLKQLLVSNGQFVAAGTPIAVITQSRTLRLKANVPSRYFPYLNNICDANIRKIDNGANDARTWTLADLNGRLVSYGRQLDADATLVPVYFEVNNVIDMLPGAFVEMFIQIRSKEKKIVVPSVAVLEDMGNYFVFVQLTPELFEKRQVQICQNDGLDTEIRSGVVPGERVVARGAMLVKMQQAAGAVDPHSGHSH